MDDTKYGLRAFIIIISTAILLLAGCSAQSPPSSATRSASQTVSETAATTTPSPSLTPQVALTPEPSQDLDLREANVLEVEFEHLGEDHYRFDVTLLHDDDGEAPSFADRWEVWDTQGNLLGERVLTHSHGTQPFTRSATIEIPEGIITILVRGHDMEHGHGGQSMRVDLGSGNMQTYEELGN